MTDGWSLLLGGGGWWTSPKNFFIQIVCRSDSNAFYAIFFLRNQAYICILQALAVLLTRAY